jgi:CshA-type fibril repeat protein
VNPTTGTITFTPEPNFTGDPTPIQYVSTDGNGNPIAPATINLDYIQVATDDNATGVPGNPVNIDVLGNDDEVNASTVQLINPDDNTTTTTLTIAGEGTWTVESNGSISFTPEPNFTGDPTPIEYTVNDTNGNPLSPASISLDYPQTLEDDSAIATVGEQVEIDVLNNDDTVDPTTVKIIDPNTGNPVTTLTVPGEGTWSVDPSTGKITFTPLNGFAGKPTAIKYVVKDTLGNTITEASISITYLKRPIAVMDKLRVVKSGATIGTVTGNDIAGEGPLSAHTYKLIQTKFPERRLEKTVAQTAYDNVVTIPTGTSIRTLHGIVSMQINGTYTYTPDAGYNGPDEFDYVIIDTIGQKDPAVVDITVSIPAPPPSMGYITGSVSERTSSGSSTPMANVTLVLFDMSGNEIARTRTDGQGNYRFTVVPGNYYIQEGQPSGYHSLSENEGGADNDSINGLLNTINVSVGVGETDIRNDFVETRSHTNCNCIPKPVIPCAMCAQGFYNIHTHNLKDNSTEIHWVDSYYEIVYDIYLNGTFIATVGEDETRYTLKNLQSNTNYTVAIVANNGYGGLTAQTIVFRTTDRLGWLPAIYHMLN